jgi:hypothetical protein
LIKILCKEKIFESKHSLKLLEKYGITFKRKKGFKFKYKFTHQKPKIKGKANFYIINSPKHKKVIVLGTVVESTKVNKSEDFFISWISDEIISTLSFKNQ